MKHVKPKTFFQLSEEELNTPGMIVWGPVQIGCTWARAAITEDGESIAVQVFDGHEWVMQEEGSKVATITIGDLMEDLGCGWDCELKKSYLKLS
jgi:hypothetical protein